MTLLRKLETHHTNKFKYVFVSSEYNEESCREDVKIAGINGRFREFNHPLYSTVKATFSFYDASQYNHRTKKWELKLVIRTCEEQGWKTFT